MPIAYIFFTNFAYSKTNAEFIKYGIFIFNLTYD